MPIGYLVTTGCLAAVAWAAMLRRRPRRSAPFRASFVFGLWLNWPLLTFLLLVASTALAVVQTDLGAPSLWVGIGLAALASAALFALYGEARRTGPVLERALDEGLGSGWREGVPDELAARLRRRPSLARVLFARRRGVERTANVRYGPARRANRLDVYRSRSGRADRPVLVHFHPLFGSKRIGTRHLFHRLAAAGWVCVAANYGGADDAQEVLAWVRAHAPDYGADPAAVFLAGSSLGGRVATLAACAPGARVAGLITLYGYYGGPPYSTPDAPPCLVVHGDRDSLVVVDDARRFVEHLRATSSNPVVYAELPGAQHGFDLFRSRRFDSVVDAIEAFACRLR